MFYIYKTDNGHKWLKVRKYVCLQMLLEIVLACAITVSVYKYFEFEATVMKHVKQGMYIMFNTTKTKASESLVPYTRPTQRSSIHWSVTTSCPQGPLKMLIYSQ